MSKTELNPCPFCNGEAFVATVEHSHENRPHGYRFHGRIMCKQCQASAGTTGFDQTYEEATKKSIIVWNRRTDSPLLEAAEEVVYQTCVVKCSMQSLGRCPYCDFQKLKAAVEMVKGETPNS